MWIGLVACSADPVEVPAQPTRPATTLSGPAWGCGTRVEPEIRTPAEEVRLARVLHLEMEAPAGAVLSIDDRVVASFPEAEIHDLPLLGLSPGMHEASVLVTCGAASATLGPLSFDAGPGPDRWPSVEIGAARPADEAPTLTLLDLQSGSTPMVAVVDDEGAPVWTWTSSEKVVDARLLPDGSLWVLTDLKLLRMDMLGNVLGRWTPALDGDGEGIVVDTHQFHHEVFPLDDGFLTFDNVLVPVAAYPVSQRDPEGEMAPATLLAPEVVEVALDGTVRQRWSIADALDTSRIGWLSRQPGDELPDWAHGNAIVVDPTDGDLVVSLRHQDAVIKLDRRTGALEWILSNPDGWREPWASARLRETPGTTWPYHQHAVMVTPEGTLLMFDNGNFDRTTPYSGHDDGRGYFSRMVEYRIDAEARTVEQIWSHAATSDGTSYSGLFGDADPLPGGRRLAVYGKMYERSDERPRMQETALRVVEAAPDNTLVWELTFREERPGVVGGWQGHRAQRLETLYPASSRP